MTWSLSRWYSHEHEHRRTTAKYASQKGCPLKEMPMHPLRYSHQSSCTRCHILTVWETLTGHLTYAALRTSIDAASRGECMPPT